MTIKLGRHTITIRMTIQRLEAVRVDIDPTERARMYAELTATPEFDALRKQAAKIKAKRIA